jgi:hypothetical protein
VANSDVDAPLESMSATNLCGKFSEAAILNRSALNVIERKLNSSQLSWNFVGQCG